jgi:hypothetical protein
MEVTGLAQVAENIVENAMCQLCVAGGVPEHPAEEPDQRMDHLAADQRERVHQNHVPAQPADSMAADSPAIPAPTTQTIGVDIVGPARGRAW